MTKLFSLADHGIGILLFWLSFYGIVMSRQDVAMQFSSESGQGRSSAYESLE